MTGRMLLFFGGDVMTGRGVDQILPHPSDPTLQEDYVKSALDYVELAEASNGPIARPVGFDYVWGDALPELERRGTDARIVNLETAVTSSDDAWDKGINYRMSPLNAPVLMAARIDACALANNHVLDWGYRGLEETLSTLKETGVAGAGAGRNLSEAESLRTIPSLDGSRRILLYSCCTEDSGVPREWAAADKRPGVNLLGDLSERTAGRVASQIAAMKRDHEIAVVSIHWGPNWGYAVTGEQRCFAHALVEAGIDIVNGHSSHHIKGIEVHRGKLILYGCGDLLDDYEGIGGYEAYRGDLGLMYFPTLGRDGELLSLDMVPTQVRRLRISRATSRDASWLASVLGREGRVLGTSVERTEEGILSLRWAG